jgi:Ca2+-binding RTX toxin-like protein
MAKPPVEVTPKFYWGTEGADVFYDNAEDPGWLVSVYNGGGGNDVFIAHPTDASLLPSGWYDHLPDSFYGGSGIDTVSYVLSDKKVVANLTTGVVERIFNGAVQSTDNLNSIENLTGSQFDDILTGSAIANRLQGGGGHDELNGLDGDDTLLGDSGNDTIWGGNGRDTIEGGTGNDKLYGGDGNDVIAGGDGADLLAGGAHDDELSGGAHNDKLVGASGNDRLEGGSGNDTLDGGSGTDTAVYSGNGAVTVSLLNNLAWGAQGVDTLSSIENVVTGGGADWVSGSQGANRIETGGGADTVHAHGGNDVVYGGSGNDNIFGGDGIDTLLGENGNDTLWGEGGNDLLWGLAGNDTISGGDGVDTIGGGDGADQIRGGAGADVVMGGAGSDVFRWEQGDLGADILKDFVLGQDFLSFGPGFLDVTAIGPVDLDEVLAVFDDGPHAWLAAKTAEAGWQFIARLENVDATAIGNAIANGTLNAPASDLFG